LKPLCCVQTEFKSEENEMLSCTNWHDLVPQIFTDNRFLKTGRRRWQAQIDDKWAGIVVAWKPPEYSNYGLNKLDFDRLLEKRADGSLDAAFVVLATLKDSKARYIAHHDADVVRDALKEFPPRDGPYGHFWALPEIFVVSAEAAKRF
jgi:hypothetical protein